MEKLSQNKNKNEVTRSCTCSYVLQDLLFNVNLSQECRSAGVECIVAPYEADAQLAYLSKEGIVDLVITEDSDLLVFGCAKVRLRVCEFLLFVYLLSGFVQV